MQIGDPGKCHMEHMMLPLAGGTHVKPGRTSCLPTSAWGRQTVANRNTGGTLQWRERRHCSLFMGCSAHVVGRAHSRSRWLFKNMMDDMRAMQKGSCLGRRSQTLALLFQVELGPNSFCQREFLSFKVAPIRLVSVQVLTSVIRF